MPTKKYLHTPISPTLPSLQDAKNAATRDEKWRIENEIKSIRERGWLRVNLNNDPTEYVRRKFVSAVERGHQEAQTSQSQEQVLDKWKKKTDIAERATKSLTHLTSFFSVGDLWTLAAKKRRWRSPAEGRKEAKRFRKSLIEARERTKAIANQSKEMVRGIAKRKTNPGDPFMRGFVLEMMKTWWLLTGRIPSSKRSGEDNPFAKFADAVLLSIWPDAPAGRSCAGVVRSVLPEFKKLRLDGVFDGDLIALTGPSVTDDERQSPTKPSIGAGKR